MTETNAQREYQVGDAVLADIRGAPIPGVVEAVEGETFLVRLAQPWTDESGEPADTVSLTADRLRPEISQAADHTLPG